MKQKHTKDTINLASTCTSESEQEYEIAAILGSRLKNGHTEYLIHWKDCDLRENSWEPEEQLKNSQQLLREYLRRCSQCSWLSTGQNQANNFEVPLMKLELNKDEDLYVTAKVISTRVNHSEGYGTEDGLTDCEMRHSFTEDESDVDADVEDTESRLKNTETLQRTCLKRKRKHKLIKQDTTESEEDVGQRTAPRRWNLHLSPCKAIQNVKEESISQMRPLLLKGYKKAAAKQPCKKLQDIEKSYPFTLLKFGTIPLLFALFLIPIGVVLMMYIL